MEYDGENNAELLALQRIDETCKQVLPPQPTATCHRADDPSCARRQTPDA